MSFRLRVIQGSNSPQEYDFFGHVVRIGRNPNNDLVLNDAAVSRDHCHIFMLPHGTYLIDQGSANGTTVNEQPANKRMPIHHGDVIRIGQTIVEFLEIKDANEQTRIAHMHLLEKLPAKVAHSIQRRPRLDLMMGVLGVCLCAAALGLLILTHQNTWVDHNQKIFELEKVNQKNVFGQGHVDVWCSQMAVFDFSYQGGLAFLSFSSSHIEQNKELSVSVNGHHFMYAPVGTNVFSYTFMIPIPLMYLHSGSNRIRFKHNSDDTENREWNISAIQIREIPLVASDIVRAQMLLALANESYEQRMIVPSALWRSYELVQEAEKLTQMMPSSDVYRSANTWHMRIERELNNIMQDTFTYAKEHEKKSALVYVQYVQHIFPDPKSYFAQAIQNLESAVLNKDL